MVFSCLPVGVVRPLNMATMPHHLGCGHHRQRKGEVWVASAPGLPRPNSQLWIYLGLRRPGLKSSGAGYNQTGLLDSPLTL